MRGGSDRDDIDDGELVVVHEDDDANRAAEEDLANNGDNRSPRRRIYPSFPSYSPAYNHAHFPPPAAHSPSSTPTPTTAVPAARHQYYEHPHRHQHYQHHHHHHHYHRHHHPYHHPRHYHNHQRQPVKRRVYGVSVDRLHAYLPVVWRTASAFRHIGHSLVFAWAPTLVFDGRFQWWCFLVLVTLAGREGWNTVEWFGGSASRAGLRRSSALLCAVGAVIYFVGLFVWGVLG